MLVTLQPIQVPQFWDVIKFACVNSDNVKNAYRDVYYTNLLHDLLSGKKTCLLGYRDETIISCLVYSINVELASGIKYIMLDNLYAFEKQPPEHWEAMWQDMLAITKKHGCDVIACNTTNPRIEEMFKYYGAELYTKTYYSYV